MKEPFAQKTEEYKGYAIIRLGPFQTNVRPLDNLSRKMLECHTPEDAKAWIDVAHTT